MEKRMTINTCIPFQYKTTTLGTQWIAAPPAAPEDGDVCPYEPPLISTTVDVLNLSFRELRRTRRKLRILGYVYVWLKCHLNILNLRVTLDSRITWEDAIQPVRSDAIYGRHGQAQKNAFLLIMTRTSNKPGCGLRTGPVFDKPTLEMLTKQLRPDLALGRGQFGHDIGISP